MKLKIGNKVFTHVWINRNGYISLAESAAAQPVTFSPGATSLRALSGDVIAPFYAPIHLRDVEQTCDNPPRNCVWDLSYSVLDLRDSYDPENIPNDPADNYILGFRASWGLFPTIPDPDNPDDPARFPGVSVVNPSANPARNIFQIWIIDRELTTGRAGDFDLDLNYSAINWQTTNTLVGLRTGPANAPDVLVDFGKFYTSLLDNSPDITPANIAFCQGPAEDPEVASFDKVYPLSCNRITIEFRDGVPNLKTYTADLSVNLAADAASRNATVPYAMTLSISNGNFDPATNVSAAIDLPAGAALVSTPASTCSQSATVATCRIPTLAAHASTTVPIQITSTQSGRQDFGVRVDSDQYDFATANNSHSTFVNVADSADLSITGCARAASVVQGTAATVTCTVRNNGPQAAAAVALEATVPNVLAFSSGTGCAVASGVLTCTAASLASGATQDFAVTFSTPTAGAATLPVTVRSTTFDPQANNGSDASFTVTAPVVVPPPPPPPPVKKGGGKLSPDALLALLASVLLVNRRRFKAAA